jgi:4-amino-4-deoxy-L-arabinose transferase-like glycosyltransferase
VLVTAVLAFTMHALVQGTQPVWDALAYSGIASGLLGYGEVAPFTDREWVVEGLAIRGYVYPLFVAGVYGLTGGVHPELAQPVQAIVFLPLTTLLIFVAGREAFSRRVGLTAAWLFALWFPAVWHTRLLYTETLLALLMALLLALLAAAIARGSPRLALLAGVVASLVAISHPSYQLLWVVMGISLAIHFWLAERQQLRLVGFYALGALPIILSYVVLTIAADLPRMGVGARGHAQGAGWTFYVSTRWETNFKPVVPDDLVIGSLTPGRLVEAGREIDAGEVEVEEDLLATIREKLARPDPYNETLTDGDYYRAGVANLLERPSSWPERLWVNSLALFVLPDDLVLAEPDSAPGQRWFRPVWRPLSALLTVLALVGLVQIIFRHRNRAVLFVPWLFQAGVIVLLSAPQARYAVPFWPTMFVAAAVPLVAVATYAARLVANAAVREKQDVPSNP